MGSRWQEKNRSWEEVRLHLLWGQGHSLVLAWIHRCGVSEGGKYLALCLLIYLSASFYLPTHPFIHLFICPSFHVSIHLLAIPFFLEPSLIFLVLWYFEVRPMDRKLFSRYVQLSIVSKVFWIALHSHSSSLKNTLRSGIHSARSKQPSLLIFRALYFSKYFKIQKSFSYLLIST